ncbi:hypothetical protein ANSO36C_30500 [Nostoc cf. commune SO-36]|uniref:Filamentous haemagglutinin FhaB/tRNA nuclease CdiA-like TPS domain-containing protein n=1 Tax=Nostoc cf. commune SO-36 TaxID=449208 RepID=A0ABN6Q1T2_NOSCO|nr:hypothetical protein [Nostoc commune]BDI17248.1 hypothetical protein ANSO36C_30500 [Nostoc cf. commune SO-36]
MNSLSNNLFIIIRGSFCLLGLINGGNFLAPSAIAQQATARGAVTLIRPSGTFLSVSGEVTLPSGSYYGGSLTISPTYGGIAGGNDETITSLTISPGVTKTTILSNPNPFINTVANLLNNSTSVEDLTTIIRAGAGNNGLGALD